MKEFRNPVFDIGVIGVALFFIGVVFKRTDEHTGNVILWIGIGLCALFSLISLVEVIRSANIKSDKKIFWVMVVFMVPVFGGFIWYIFTRRNESAKL